MRAKEELIIDLRSGSIGALVIGSDGPNRRVVMSTRRLLALQQSFEPSRLISQVTAELKALIAEVRTKRSQGRISKIDLVIGSPWYLSQTRSVTHKSVNQFQYNERLAQKLFNDEESSFRIEKFGQKQTETIEREMLSISLNGYPTNRPIGKRANEISISFYLSMIDHEFLTLMRKAIESEVRCDISVHTFPFMALTAAPEIIGDTVGSYILVDIGGEVSELSLIRNKTAIESFSFPLGAHSITRALSVAFGTSLQEAGSIYHAYASGQVDSTVRDKILKALSDTRVKWTTYVHGMLDKISTSYVLPPNVIILGSIETTGIFSDVMTDPDIAKLFANQISATVIVPEVNKLRLPLPVMPGAGDLDIFLVVELSAIERLRTTS